MSVFLIIMVGFFIAFVVLRKRRALLQDARFQTISGIIFVVTLSLHVSVAMKYLEPPPPFFEWLFVWFALLYYGASVYFLVEEFIHKQYAEPPKIEEPLVTVLVAEEPKPKTAEDELDEILRKNRERS